MKPRNGPAADDGEPHGPAQPPTHPPAGRKPTHRLYRVLGDGRKATWTPIGAAWPNKDGLGFSLQCNAIPLQGRLVLREITELEAQDEAA